MDLQCKRHAGILTIDMSQTLRTYSFKSDSVGYPSTVENFFAPPPPPSAQGIMGFAEEPINPIYTLPELTMKGNIDLLKAQTPSLGFCGARNVSEKGLKATAEFSKIASNEGIVIVSGNARGVDEAAHYACLENDGYTILVLPEGINHFRPRMRLREVWDWARVLVISQFAPDAPWSIGRAMARNKLVIALSNAILVVEAGEKGGTLDAGIKSIKSERPLLIADYEGIPKTATGNKLLESKGGIPTKSSDILETFSNCSALLPQGRLSI